MWNTNKTGGWDVYKMLTQNNHKLEDATKEEDDPTEAMNLIDKEMNGAKYKAFGKIKFRNSVKANKEVMNLQKKKSDICAVNDLPNEELEELEKEIAENLLQEQRKNLEREFNNLKEIGSRKGKSASIFDLKNKVVGKKKMEQEATILKNPHDDKEVTEPKEILKISLDYCTTLLTNRQPKDKFKEDIQLKVDVHEKQMMEAHDDDVQFTRKLYDKSMKVLSTKNPNKYKFILKAGQSVKNSIFNLFETVWSKESEPSQWRQSNIIQIYKGKWAKEDLANQRNIHTKLEVPKFFGHIVIGLAKDKITENMSKFQLGTKPGHRVQEHLFVMRSIITLYELWGKPIIVQLYDISKFFDREMLRDCMDTLYNNGIKGKLYRLIYEMNRETRIKVRTAVGITSEQNTGEGVGQGTLDGAIISACSIDYSVDKFFSKSSQEISYGELSLQPLLYQDDIFRLCSDPFSAQIGNALIDTVMETKLLDFNIDKSCYLVIGPKAGQNKIREHFKETPLTLSGQPMKEANEEKYLGDYISSEGLARSTMITIKKRYDKVKTAVREIGAVIEDCRARVIGGLITGLEIWEIAVMPYILNNSETWTDIPKDAMDLLENLQLDFLRNLLDTPRTCPTPSLLWETGTITMQNKILKKKLLFYHHLLHLAHDSLAWEVASIQEKLNFPGLMQECAETIQVFNLPEARSCSKYQWKKIINKLVKEKTEEDLLNTVSDKDYKKLSLEDMKEEKFGRQSYLHDLDIPAARMKFGIRSRMVRTIKMNYKNDQANKNKRWKCDDCMSIDSQEHILWCPAYSQLRQAKNLDNDRDLTKYFQEVLRFRDK